jgi:Delta7-sterol 5-desaturase
MDHYFFILRTIADRYFVIAGIAFLLFYVLFKRKLAQRKIQQRFPKNKDIAREIIYSVTTMIIFAFIPLMLLYNPSVAKYTTFYKDIHAHSMLYFWLAFPLMFVMHDTYFYWTHRLMHHPKLFRWFHLVHHQSVNPSPWAAYAFHPLEAIVEIGIYPVFLFTIPMHSLHFFLFFLLSLIYNVYGHLGYELYPKGFSRNVIGRWINTSVSHNQHHQYFKGNYGLYFLFWDRVMGTIREDYDERFVQRSVAKKDVALADA